MDAKSGGTTHTLQKKQAGAEYKPQKHERRNIKKKKNQKGPTHPKKSQKSRTMFYYPIKNCHLLGGGKKAISGLRVQAPRNRPRQITLRTMKKDARTWPQTPESIEAMARIVNSMQSRKEKGNTSNTGHKRSSTKSGNRGRQKGVRLVGRPNRMKGFSRGRLRQIAKKDKIS